MTSRLRSVAGAYCRSSLIFLTDSGAPAPGWPIAQDSSPNGERAPVGVVESLTIPVCDLRGDNRRRAQFRRAWFRAREPAALLEPRTRGGRSP